MATATKTISLLDYCNDRDGLGYLWWVSLGAPAGDELTHNVDTADEAEYCDLSEVEWIEDLYDLQGTVQADGSWEWGGRGDAYDVNRNSMRRITARANASERITTEITRNGVVAGTSCTATLDDPCRNHSADLGEAVYDALIDAWEDREEGDMAVEIEHDGDTYRLEVTD